MSKSIYCIKENRLLIIDEKLGIFIDIDFCVSDGPTDFSDDKIHEIKEYYPSGTLKSQRYYLGKKLHGSSTYFFEDGQVASKVWYVNGKKQGKCFQYYKNARIYSLQKYKDNLKQGSHKYFYEDGTLKSEFYYENDLLDKKATLFWESGHIKREMNFLKGKRQGFDKIFSYDQKPLFIGEYENDIPVGHHKSYDGRGVLREEVVYKGETYQKSTYDHLGNLIVDE